MILKERKKKSPKEKSSNVSQKNKVSSLAVVLYCFSFGFGLFFYKVTSVED